MNPYIQILRPSNGIMAAIAVLIGFLLSSGQFTFSYHLIYGIVAVFILSSAGLVINDYYDVEMDKINAPQRPIPSGKISKRSALIYSIILFVIGISFAGLINTQCFILAIVNSLLEIIYSWKAKKMFFIGNVVDSWFVLSSFLFGSMIVTGIMSTGLVVIVVCLLAFLSNMGREIFGDIEDIVGDKAVGANTLPVKLGVNKAKLIAYLFIIASVILSFLPFEFHLLGRYYIYIVVLADIIFIYSLTKNAHATQKWTRIAMIVALIAFIAGLL
ncbi:MAG: UbiA family prenyltransferase [Candidatus Aenigmarchaeota archaeon]|nr:UbiA family prenyltransferase [Candidatus Aenigmarchaeota archaeon]